MNASLARPSSALRGGAQRPLEQGPAAPERSRGFWASAWLRLRRDRVTLVALGILLVIAGLSIAAPFISGALLHTDPARFVRTPAGRIATLQPPGPGYPLGTDDLGRDVLTRLLYAGQVSLLLGSMVALVSIAVGAPLGVLAAYFGGWVDDLVNAAVQLLRHRYRINLSICGLRLRTSSTTAAKPASLHLRAVITSAARSTVDPVMARLADTLPA